MDRGSRKRCGWLLKTDWTELSDLLETQKNVPWRKYNHKHSSELLLLLLWLMIMIELFQSVCMWPILMMIPATHCVSSFIHTVPRWRPTNGAAAVEGANDAWPVVGCEGVLRRPQSQVVSHGCVCCSSTIRTAVDLYYCINKLPKYCVLLLLFLRWCLIVLQIRRWVSTWSSSSSLWWSWSSSSSTSSDRAICLPT